LENIAAPRQKSWWRRPPIWLLGVVLLGVLIFIAVEEIREPAPISYSAFLDQLERGNVASVTFRGNELDGYLKQGSEAFRSRVPDFGDPGLIAELRKQHVVFDVRSPSQWTALFAHLPWPMVALVAFVTFAAFLRLVRGSAAGDTRMPMHPAGGMIGLVSKVFGLKGSAESGAQRRPPGEGNLS